jgi:hypothetical protein
VSVRVSVSMSVSGGCERACECEGADRSILLQSC